MFVTLGRGWVLATDRRPSGDTSAIIVSYSVSSDHGNVDHEMWIDIRGV
jgi:hypothetical protein